MKPKLDRIEGVGGSQEGTVRAMLIRANHTSWKEWGTMKKVLAAFTSVVFFAGLASIADAQSNCPPEVAKAKQLLSQKAGMAKTSKGVQAPRSLAGARGQDAQAPRGQDAQAPRGQDAQAPRGDRIQAPRSLAGARGQDAQAPRGQDAQAPRGQDAQAPRGQDAQAPRGQDAQAPRGQDAQAPRGQDAQAPRGQDAQAPRGQDAQAPRGQDAQAPRGQDAQAPRGQDAQAPRGQDAQAPRSLAGAQQPSGDSISKASTLIKQAEAACKAGDMKTAKSKANAAITILR
jgi:hypothetical protein